MNERAAPRLTLSIGVCVLTSTLVLACGGDGPTAPSPPSPPPATGPQIFTGAGALDISSEDAVCTPKTPAWGFQRPRVAAPVTVLADAGGWVARPELARFGDIEIRLSLTSSNATEPAVAGTVHGTALDLFSAFNFPNPSRVAVSGPAPGEDGVLAGTYHVQLRAVFGTVSGRLVFTDNQGGVMTCTGGDWFLFSVAR